MADFWKAILEFTKDFGTNILEAVALLTAGIVIIRVAVLVFRALLQRTKLEGTATSFLISLIRAVLGLVLFFLIMRVLGIDTGNIVAVIAASGLAVGLALQDSLSNVASGIILLFTKPFKKGDTVEIGSAKGKVRNIKITTTELQSADNVMITIPNSSVVSEHIVNYSTRPTRRLDIEVSAAYGCAPERVKEVVLEIANSDERVLKTPAPVAFVSKLDSSGVLYKVRMWTENKHYWDVSNEFLEKVLTEFKKSNLEIPYNKLDVTLKGEEK